MSKRRVLAHCRSRLQWVRCALPGMATSVAVRLDQSTRAPSVASLLLQALT